MKRLRRTCCLLLALCLLLPLSACGGKSDGSFTVILPANIQTLDPQIATGQSADWVIGSIFEGLCRVDSDGKAVPGVADRWSHDKNYTRFTFHLRKTGWSNGEAVTADDFRFAICRALAPETGVAAPEDLFVIRNARAIYDGYATEEYLGVQVENERTLVIELEQGYEDFPLLTAGNHYMPCNQAFFEECAGHYGQAGQYVLTNGPFTLPHEYAWDTDYGERKLSLVRANDYRGDRKVQPASLTYLIDYNELYDTDRFAGLSDGALDLRTLPNAQTAALYQEEQDGKVLSIENGVTGILLNAASDDLHYVGTRQLFLQSLDREVLLAASEAQDEEAAGIMPEIVHWNGKPYYGDGEFCYAQQDEDVAQTIPSLLELLHFDEVPCITLLYPQEEGESDMGPIAPEIVLNQWNTALSGAFNMQGVPAATLNYRVATGDYDAAVYTLKAGPTAFHVLGAFSGASVPLLFQDEDFDEALIGMHFTKEEFGRLERQLCEDYVFYPLVRTPTYYAVAPGVSGIQINADGRPDFISARKK